MLAMLAHIGGGTPTGATTDPNELAAGLRSGIRPSPGSLEPDVPPAGVR